MINLASNDVQRLMDVCPNVHLAWSVPLQIASTHASTRASPLSAAVPTLTLDNWAGHTVAFTLLGLLLGPAAFVGLGVIVIIVGIQVRRAASRPTPLRRALTRTARSPPTQISTSRITGAILAELPTRTDRRIRLVDSAILGIEYASLPRNPCTGRCSPHSPSGRPQPAPVRSPLGS